MNPTSKNTGKTVSKNRRKRRSSIASKRKGKFKVYKKNQNETTTEELQKKDILAIKVSLINSGLDSTEI